MSIGDVLKDEGRGSSGFRLARFRRGLVVAEVALSCALLVAAGMAVKSSVVLGRTDFDVTTSSMFNDGDAVELMSPRWRLRPFARHA